MSLKKEYTISRDLLYSGDTKFSEDSDEDPFSEDLLMSEASKYLKVDELAKTFDVDQKKLLLKIDLHVVPPFGIIFFLAYLNRLFGLLQIEQIYPSLEITQLQFFMSYVAFFVPYIVGQFFCNSLLAYVRPHGFMSIGVLVYGSLALGTGFVKSYPAFVVCQFMHGLFQLSSEAAIFYILAHYYDKRESLARFVGIFSFSCLSGVASTLIAYLVDAHIAPTSTDGWRYLLIISGAITMGASVITFFTIPDFPEGALFLSDNETAFLVRKLELFSGKSGYEIPLDLKRVMRFCLDPVIFIPAIASIGIAYVTLAYSLFLPVFIFMVIGESIRDLNKYLIFPWLAAFFWMNFSTYLSNKFCRQNRSGFIAFNIGLTFAGGGLMYWAPADSLPNKLKYAGTFLCVMGGYTASPLLMCWLSMNLGGHLRKSIGIAFQVSCMSIGGLIAIFTFYDNNMKYTRGFLGGFVLVLLSLVLVGVYLVVLRRENRKKRTSAYKRQFGMFSEEERVCLGDKNPALDYLF